MCEKLFYHKVSDVLFFTIGRYWLVLGDTGSAWGGTWWYWGSIGWYWLIYDGTGSVEGGASWYLVLCQYGAVRVGTWWYWVSITWYCLVSSGTGLVKGSHACIYRSKWRFGQLLP